MNLVNEAKRRAARASIELVRSGQIVGLGSGSTANYMIEELGRRIHEEKLEIIGIPTSNQAAELATKCKIPLTTLDDHPRIDLAIDGADQVDPRLNLIKGMGGALTREKIVDDAAEMLAIIVDESKMTPQLGINQVVPVEVIPFSITPVISKLVRLGGTPSIRNSKNKIGHFVTDNGNIIIDVNFGAINSVKRLEKEIKMISGVVESGLFVNMVKIVFIGSQSGVRKIKRRRHEKFE
jgi:ribose 5-phosphate isomerase A